MKFNIVEVNVPISENNDLKSVSKMFKNTFKKYKYSYFSAGLIAVENKHYTCAFIGNIPEYELECLKSIGFDIHIDTDDVELIHIPGLVAIHIVCNIPFGVTITRVLFNIIRDKSEEVYKF